MVLKNALYLNKQIFAFKLTNSPPCSSCKAEHEITAHVFHSCTLVQLFLEPDSTLPHLLPQAAIFGFRKQPNCQRFGLLHQL